MAVAGRRLVVQGGMWTAEFAPKEEGTTERETCFGRRREQTERDLEGWASGTGVNKVRKIGSCHGFVRRKVDGSGHGVSRKHRRRIGFWVRARGTRSS